MSRPQSEAEWKLVLDVIERLYAEVRSGNWDGVRKMLHGYTKPAESSGEPAEQLQRVVHELRRAEVCGGGLKHYQIKEMLEWLRSAEFPETKPASEPAAELYTKGDVEAMVAIAVAGVIAKDRDGELAWLKKNFPYEISGLLARRALTKGEK